MDGLAATRVRETPTFETCWAWKPVAAASSERRRTLSIILPLTREPRRVRGDFLSGGQRAQKTLSSIHRTPARNDPAE